MSAIRKPYVKNTIYERVLIINKRCSLTTSNTHLCISLSLPWLLAIPGVDLYPNGCLGSQITNIHHLCCNNLRGIITLLSICRLFQNFPEYQALFSKFRGKTLEEVSKSAALRAHGTVFMHGVAGFMDSLQDAESLQCLIEANVERHYVRGIRTQHFNVSCQALCQMSNCINCFTIPKNNCGVLIHIDNLFIPCAK